MLDVTKKKKKAEANQFIGYDREPMSISRISAHISLIFSGSPFSGMFYLYGLYAGY